MRLFTHLILLCGLTAPLSASAWGADGHRLIAELAESQLSPAATAEVGRLLKQEPGATMASVSTWADEKRSGSTAPLHYVNLPEDDCNYSRQRDCPDGRCVVEAIKAKVAILKSHASETERLIALKYVIHLVGDIHQPLHVGLASDKGGNLFQVRMGRRGSNLHAVWDAELIKRRPGGLARLFNEAALAVKSASASMEAAGWAAESCEARRRDGFYPGNRQINAEYAADWDSELVRRLSLAGARLANVLNETLDATR
ncbi:S1/P1 nuclease [Roseateles sp. P5_E4]